MNASHPAVAEYLARFDRIASSIPVSRREALRQEVLDHLTDAIPADLADVDAELILAGFGSPDEIVAQELEGSPVARAAPRRARLPWVVGSTSLVVVAVLLATVLPVMLGANSEVGSAGPGPIDPFNVVTAHPDGVDRVSEGRAYEEYEDTIASLGTLPAGAAWPEGVPKGLNAGSVDGGGVMQAGLGASVAQFTYLCAWEAEYISAEQVDDARLLTTALAALEDFADRPFMSTTSPDGEWKRRVIGPLTFADSTGLRRDFPGTCEKAGIRNAPGAMREQAQTD